MRTRSDFIQRLRESEKFKSALATAKDDDERKRLTAAAEQFVDSFASLLVPLIEKAENDPEFAMQLGRQLVERRGLVTASDPAMSGSNG